LDVRELTLNRPGDVDQFGIDVRAGNGQRTILGYDVQCGRGTNARRSWLAVLPLRPHAAPATTCFDSRAIADFAALPLDGRGDL